MTKLHAILSGIIIIVALVVPCACSNVKPEIQPDDDESIIISDTLTMCSRMGDGRTGAWTQPLDRSDTWRRLAIGADRGEMAAYREILYWMKKAHSKGSSCTDEIITRFERRVSEEK